MKAWRTKVTPGIEFFICGVSSIHHLWRAARPLTGKPKIQISCKITFIREGIIFWPNSVRAPRCINCCLRCHSSTLNRAHVSARLRRNHPAVWISYETEDSILHERERPSINLYPPSHISPSRRRRRPWDSNEGRQAAHKLPADHPPLISSMTQDKGTSARYQIPGGHGHTHCMWLSAAARNHWYHLLSCGDASFKGQRKKRLHPSLPTSALSFFLKVRSREENWGVISPPKKFKWQVKSLLVSLAGSSY